MKGCGCRNPRPPPQHWVEATSEVSGLGAGGFPGSPPSREPEIKLHPQTRSFNKPKHSLQFCRERGQGRWGGRPQQQQQAWGQRVSHLCACPPRVGTRGPRTSMDPSLGGTKDWLFGDPQTLDTDVAQCRVGHRYRVSRTRTRRSKHLGGCQGRAGDCRR